MDGTTTPSHGRSVQLAVMGRPTASIVQAVVEAQRRQETSVPWSALERSGGARRLSLRAA